MDYARFFFRHDLAEPGGDALLALENNWRGSLAENSSVEGTLKLWQAIEKTHGPLGDNWRLEMHLMRAYYDAYTRQRLLRETRLQQQALGRLRSAGRLGAAEAIRLAQADLASATTACLGDAAASDPRALATARALGDHLAQSLYREAAEHARAAVVVARAHDRLSETFGPYNPQALAARALAQLEATSPAFLRAYLAGLEDLASLRQLPEPKRR